MVCKLSVFTAKEDCLLRQATITRINDAFPEELADVTLVLWRGPIREEVAHFALHCMEGATFSPHGLMLKANNSLILEFKEQFKIACGDMWVENLNVAAQNTVALSGCGSFYNTNLYNTNQLPLGLAGLSRSSNPVRLVQPENKIIEQEDKTPKIDPKIKAYVDGL